MKKPKLFMILVGFKPEGFITEQHEIVFIVAEELFSEKTYEMILKKLPIPPGTSVHIDAWVEVTYVDNHKITVVEGRSYDKPARHLYFANLGGYKKTDFAEYHKKVLIVVGDASLIKPRAQQDPFFKEMHDIKGAGPHVDNRYRINGEVEDELKIEDILDGYHLVIEESYSGEDSLLTPNITGFHFIGEK